MIYLSHQLKQGLRKSEKNTVSVVESSGGGRQPSSPDSAEYQVSPHLLECRMRGCEKSIAKAPQQQCPPILQPVDNNRAAYEKLVMKDFGCIHVGHQPHHHAAIIA
jgi:hypothetical protein